MQEEKEISLSELNPVFVPKSLTNDKLLYDREIKRIFPNEKSVSHFRQDSHSQQLLDTTFTTETSVRKTISEPQVSFQDKALYV